MVEKQDWLQGSWFLDSCSIRIGTAASGDTYWFACPRSGMGYAVMKQVGGSEDWNKCISGLKLVAVDWSGVGAAAGVYS